MRNGNLFVSVLLSLLVTWVCAGVTVARCAHTGLEKVVTPLNDDEPRHCGDESQDHCVTFHVVKMLSVSPTSHVLAPPVDMVLPPYLLFHRLPVVEAGASVWPFSTLSQALRESPRAYLQRLTVLII